MDRHSKRKVLHADALKVDVDSNIDFDEAEAEFCGDAGNWCNQFVRQIRQKSDPSECLHLSANWMALVRFAIIGEMIAPTLFTIFEYQSAK